MGILSFVGGMFSGTSRQLTEETLALKRAQRERLRIETELANERKSLEIAAVRKRREHITESVVAPGDWFAPLLDRMAEAQADPNQFPFGNMSSRRYGQNWPYILSDQHLDMYRTLSRNIYDGNAHGKGLINGFCAYVVGNGMTLRATQRKRGDDSPLVGKLQAWLDNFADVNTFSEFQQEAFVRSKRDGEAIVRHFPKSNGQTHLRFVWPEHVRQPPMEIQDVWSFGIETDPNDVEEVKAFSILPDSSPSDQPEIVSAEEIDHIKCNVDRGIKRGMPELCLDLRDSLESARKLRRNTAEGAAVRAAFAYIRKHATATSSQVDDFLTAQQDYLAPRVSRDGQQNRATELIEPGTVVDIDAGQEYIASPADAGVPFYVQAVQMCLRAAGCRWNAPEGLASGDYSNNNFASALVAEAPFRLRCEMEQEFYRTRFMRIVMRAVQHAIDIGALPPDTLEVCEVQMTPRSLEVRDKQQEASTNQIYTGMGIKSPQTISQELGLDYENEQSNIEAALARKGPEGSTMPLPGESGFESFTDDGEWEIFEAREGLTKKIITDKNGVKRTVYVRGGGEEVGLKKDSGTIDKSSQNRRPTIEETLEHVNRLRSDMTQEGLKEFAQAIRGHTVAELREIKLKLGLKASGRKAEYADKIAYRAVNGMPVKITVPSKPKIGKAYNVSPDEIIADPNRFQFKLNTSGPSGTGDELKGVGKWNADLAGVISVWKDPADGKTYVVNGHHRLELSKRLKAGRIAVRYLDAGSATEARGKGALINIAEGRGTAVDAAKFMRDTGTTVDDFANEGVSLRGKVAADAATLTALSDPLFSRVARGSLDTDRALAIASNLPDHDAQAALVEHIEKQEDRTGREYSPKVVAEAAKEAAITAKTTEKTSNLFGDEENEKSLVMPRAELKAHIRSELSKEIRDYQAVASQRRADRVSGEGNILNISANKAAADKAENAADTFNRLSGYKGELSDILNDEAVNYDAAKSQKDREAIRKRTLERVRAALPKVEQDAIQGMGSGT